MMQKEGREEGRKGQRGVRHRRQYPSVKLSRGIEGSCYIVELSLPSLNQHAAVSLSRISNVIAKMLCRPEVESIPIVVTCVHEWEYDSKPQSPMYQ